MFDIELEIEFKLLDFYDWKQENHHKRNVFSPQ